jgi:hypothetical protein
MSNKIIYFFVFAILVMFWGGVIYLVQADPQSKARYNCSIAGISPDFTTEMKAKCRELPRNKL